MSVFVTSDGGLTAAGYGACIALIIALLLAVCFFRGTAGQSSQEKTRQLSVKKMTCCSMCIALAAVTCMIKIFEFPFGGSVTLCSMLFAMLPGWLYGLSTGLLCGLIYGLLQFVLGPYIMTPMQVCFDYFFAFSIMGIGGLFANQKHGLVIGYLAAVTGRWIMATIAGLIWVSLGSVAWEGWAPLPYSMAYNGAYIGAEAAVTLLILWVPAVKQALLRVKAQALS